MSPKAQLEIGERAAHGLSGRVLAGKWTLECVIGTGGMSTVYEARHRNGKLAAVKVLHPHLAALPRAKRRFLREGFLANQVGHPGAVSVLDDDVDDDGTVFLVMELLRGETLAKRVERLGPLPVNEAIGVMDEILAVLAAAHVKGIVHRDVKPSNVFLTSDGEVKVLDFGIARLREERPRREDSFSTQAGGLLGTPGFMAPEQARGAWDEVDGRTDIWGLGATMFTVLTGRSVHHGKTANELLIAAATQAPPPVGQFVRLPAWVAALIDRALRLDPGERWPDASTLRRELAFAGREAPPAETHEDGGAAAAVRTIDDRMNVRGWSSVRQIAPAAALACAIAGVIMFEARPQQREETYRTASPIARPVSTSSASIAQQPLVLRNTPVLEPKPDLETVARPSPAASARNDKPARPMPRLNPSSRQVGAPSSSSIGSTGPHPASSSTPTSLAEPASSANLLDRWQ